MAESAEEIYARVVAEVGEGGRLPAPAVTRWDTFPWEVLDGAIVPKVLAPPAPEPPRKGEDAADCFLCGPEVAGVIWENERWRVKPHPEPSGLPIVLFLEPKEHLDFPDLGEDMAAELGVLSVRLARIVESLPEIARCHVWRVGDGAAHLHVWFLARPEGLLALRGSFAVDWDDILLTGPAEMRAADHAEIARKLATHDGRALV